MTSGEKYNLNKEIYDKYAMDFIKKNISKIGDFCHRPFEMLTFWQRTICEKIDNEKYLVYEGFVKKTEYYEGRKIKKYLGEKMMPKIYNLENLIYLFAFEFAINPKSGANELISKKTKTIRKKTIKYT